MLILNYNDKEYKLDFDLDSAVATLNAGFNPNVAAENTMKFTLVHVPILIHGAFHKHHPTITAKKARTIWAAQDDKSGKLASLFKALQATYADLIDSDDDEDDEENVEQEAEE